MSGMTTGNVDRNTSRNTPAAPAKSARVSFTAVDESAC